LFESCVPTFFIVFFKWFCAYVVNPKLNTTLYMKDLVVNSVAVAVARTMSFCSLECSWCRWWKNVQYNGLLWDHGLTRSTEQMGLWS
jgi:hypothetical protein